MFISHRVDVTNLLKDANELEIHFDSAMLRGRDLLKEHAHEHTFYVRQTEMSRVPVRKAQCMPTLFPFLTFTCLSS